MSKEAMKLALEALDINNKAWKALADSGDAGFWEAEEQPFYELSVKAITALREALAEQPARPYRQLQDNGSKYFGPSWDKADQALDKPQKRPQNCGTGYCSCIECVMKPTVPDAIGPNEDELASYAAGWNDCRALMLSAKRVGV